MKNRSIINQNITNVREPRYGYHTNSVQQVRSNQIIYGNFNNENSASDRALKKLNDTLSSLLLCVIILSTISYYFVVSAEIKLNQYSRETTLLNVENAELQNKLDRLKSFNNVDLTMQKNNILQRPEQVIEATEVSTVNSTNTKKQNSVKAKAWSLGY